MEDEGERRGSSQCHAWNVMVCMRDSASSLEQHVQYQLCMIWLQPVLHNR